MRLHDGGTETQGTEFKIIRYGGDAMNATVHQQRLVGSQMFKVTSVPSFFPHSGALFEPQQVVFTMGT